MISEEEQQINSKSNIKMLNLVSHYDRVYGSDESTWPVKAKKEFDDKYNTILQEHQQMLMIAGISKIEKIMGDTIEVQYPAEWKEAEKNYQEAMIQRGVDPRQIYLADKIVKDARPCDRPRPQTESRLDQWGI